LRPPTVHDPPPSGSRQSNLGNQIYDVDVVFIRGGFPEMHAERLEAK